MYKFTEIFNDTLPSYRIDNLPERYSEGFLKQTELTIKKRCYEKIKPKLKQNVFVYMSSC